MSSKWHEKKARIAEVQFERALWTAPDDTTQNVITDGALGKGDTQVFERKLTKEEKKAAAKAKREAKKKSKNGDEDDDGNEEDDSKFTTAELLQAVQGDATAGAMTSIVDDGIDHDAADKLASAGTICTFATNRKGVDSRSRDINVQNFTLQHMGMVMLDETELVFNHGNRYGLIGRNGSGKSTLLKVIGARAIPVPSNIDLFLLDQEVPPSDTVTAIEAVMSVDEERLRLEQQAEDLNNFLSILSDKMANNEDNDNADTDESGKTLEEQQEDIMEALTSVYERLDALDADTAEVRARLILRGLGFTHEMQGKLTKDFSGGWRMRVALARALFISPAFLVLDEPTAHLDMESVIWLEDRLSKYTGILLLVSHSQDFMNQVCTHTIHLTNKKKLQYYDGNYDQFVKTKSEKEENQMKQYKWEQDQIKSMKEYIARFGHGTAKNAKQAQSKEKVLEKMIRVPPVLAFHDVSFGYPGCQPLYTNVNLGVDLDSRIALVGPNGAGKTTLIKLMAGELIQTLGDIRPHGHLKLGRFTQHFVDVLDLDKTPLEFFEQKYPDDPHEEQRKYLGRFGVSGKMQLQRMAELSDGQKSRVVFAYLGRLRPHILLLDEPTNSLDPESIDALAKAINEFEGGMVLVSHDMRLISQVAKEIWICDNKTITPYKGDIQSFKLAMRTQMGLEDGNKPAPKVLRGDASVKINSSDASVKPKAKKLEAVDESKSSVTTPVAEPPGIVAPTTAAKSDDKQPKLDDDDTTTATTITTLSSVPSVSAEQPSNKAPAPSVAPGVNNGTSNTTTTSSSSSTAPTAAPVKGRYIPPHLRKKMMEEQQQQQQQS